MKTTEINIYTNNVLLQGELSVPYNANALIIFSHGSGSSRFSPRNRHVAEIFQDNNMATLLIDLLTENEDKVQSNRFNIDLLAGRLAAVTDYVKELSDFRNLPIGYFGASTGAASALKASLRVKNGPDAIVSRGGRPDLAGGDLMSVTAPTLLIIGSNDSGVITLNREAFSKLTCERAIRIVNGAGHLFEEPGRLDEVARLAVDWFNTHLVSAYKIKTN